MVVHSVFITEFVGTCSSKEIGDFALRYGRPVTYKYAMNLIKRFDLDIYNLFSPEYYNPWESETNIKTVKGERYLHVVHSAIDYIFKLDKQ